jgi:hypothetical protein
MSEELSALLTFVAIIGIPIVVNLSVVLWRRRRYGRIVAHQSLAQRRFAAGDRSDKTVAAMFSEALTLELHGHWMQAIMVLDQLHHGLQGTSQGEYADRSAAVLRERLTNQDIAVMRCEVNRTKTELATLQVQCDAERAKGALWRAAGTLTALLVLGLLMALTNPDEESLRLQTLERAKEEQGGVVGELAIRAVSDITAHRCSLGVLSIGTVSVRMRIDGSKMKSESVGVFGRWWFAVPEDSPMLLFIFLIIIGLVVAVFESVGTAMVLVRATVTRLFRKR